MSLVDGKTKRRLRFIALKLIYEQHEKQRHRYDDVTLMSVLRRLNYDVYLDLMRAVLQDLKERKLIDYEHSKDLTSGKFSIFKIEVRPPGRDLVEANEDNVFAEI